MSNLSTTDFESFTPKYMSVAKSLMADISAGKLGCGDRLESQNELAWRFGITPVTARKAVDVLKTRKLVAAKGGKGTFVISRDIDGVSIENHLKVGYVTGASHDVVYMKIMDGVFTTLQNQNIDVVYFNDKQLKASSLESLAEFSRRVDGLIVPGTLPTDVLKKLLDLGIKLVAVQVRPELPQVPYVGPDYQTAAYQATRHLIEQGHCRLGTICYIPEFIHTRQFMAGYRRALEEFNIPALERFEYCNCNRDASDFYLAAQSLFANSSDRPTGVVCMTELKARLAVRYLTSIGLGVPEDVSVICQYDGVESICEPPFLTTMAHDPKGIGSKAAEILINTIRKGEVNRIERIELPPKLIERQTTGPCPANATDELNGSYATAAEDDVVLSPSAPVAADNDQQK